MRHALQAGTISRGRSGPDSGAARLPRTRLHHGSGSEAGPGAGALLPPGMRGRHRRATYTSRSTSFGFGRSLRIEPIKATRRTSDRRAANCTNHTAASSRLSRTFARPSFIEATQQGLRHYPHNARYQPRPKAVGCMPKLGGTQQLRRAHLVASSRPLAPRWLGRR
jgi:hypothetical protein